MFIVWNNTSQPLSFSGEGGRRRPGQIMDFPTHPQTHATYLIMEKQNTSWSFYFSVSGWLSAWKTKNNLLNSLGKGSRKVTGRCWRGGQSHKKKQCSKLGHGRFSCISTAWEKCCCSRWSSNAGLLSYRTQSLKNWCWWSKGIKDALKSKRATASAAASSLQQHFYAQAAILKRWVTRTPLSQSEITHAHVV